MGTLVLTGKISFLLLVRCVYVDVDRKLSFFFLFFFFVVVVFFLFVFFPFFFCMLCLSCSVSISHISRHAKLSSRSGLDNVGPKRV